jgi:hypothetical protein
MISARSHEHPEHRLHGPTRETHGFGSARSVVENLALPLLVPDAQAVLPLVGSNLADERHPACDDLK